MTIESRLAVAAALQAAGWTGTPGRLGHGILKHPSGAVWQISNEAGGCSLDLDVPDGPTVDFRSKVPNSVVVAACLAASGQLDPAPTGPPPPSALLVAELETEAQTAVVTNLLATATTTTEINAVARVALRAGLLWRCHPCKRDHYLRDNRCVECGASRPTDY
ncbi:hypothetical protein [Streptomyces sp. ITFR-6]|uniref:hypothetical protein n=1 Tax=Streptomyces sp. ITFR-6 TaxID=3075197 RepID=UPI00288A55EB|nr:hypothetical protein [Streptomyces sp. ITFR-6]WNI31472.1 hypothetical protein RLT59_23785 [Streptomyces sp. ITFR-6]